VGHIRDRWKDPARAGKGKRWQVKYQVDGRERDGGSFAVKAVAQRKLVELEGSVNRGQWVDPTDRTTVVELVRSYAAARMHKPRTAERTESLIKNHLEKTPFGGRRIAAVKPSEVQAWVSDRAKVLAPSTMRILVALVRAAFNAAVLDRLIPVTPFQRITLPRVERERVVALTGEQVAAIADAIGPRYRAMVITQSGLGLRIGELLALRLEDIDWLRRTVRVEDQIDRATRERVPPKTPKSRRTLPLPEVVSNALAEHIQRFPPAVGTGLLFHTRDGLPLAHDWYANKVFAKAAAKAGMPPGTTPHACRHHFATELLAGGMSVIDVAELLGHEDATLVVKTYGHGTPNRDDRARKVIDSLWRGVSTPAGGISHCPGTAP